MLLKLKAAMIAHFGSTVAFARVVGLDQARVSEVIHRKRQLSRADQLRWSKILGFDCKELFGNGDRILDSK